MKQIQLPANPFTSIKIIGAEPTFFQAILVITELTQARILWAILDAHFLHFLLAVLINTVLFFLFYGQVDNPSGILF